MHEAILEIFLSVAEEGSVTRAARRLGRAPSNVSTRVQQLEEDLGTNLFSREGKKMSLTREGSLFLPYAKRLRALAREARKAMKSPVGGAVLRVGTMESTAASRLPPVLKHFADCQPEVQVALTIAASRELIASVVSGDIDCAFVALPPKQMQQEWHSTKSLKVLCATSVYTERLLLVLPNSHPPLNGAEDVQLETLAALEPGCTYRNVAERWLGLGAPVRTTEVSSYHAIIATVLGGHAVGVIPESVLAMLNWASEVRTHEIANVETVLVTKSDTRSDVFEAFRSAIASQSHNSSSAAVLTH
ncbi:hypothetical protein ASD54_21615 [Rhizobium sp. Root149]|uniref:LysR family transcriptional regulator n=1 Tax=Rhizobium sp. Root149 TaxID=1736473 RepID=UPI0007146B73|nr:LysR family transcriptional regulator [Rhizobium sp. Root149]KQZ46620.1 hypothetical protein ASD54_21615 [Rhizobium sp. Root149]